MIKFSGTYKSWIEELKTEIQKSQIKAAISVNKELINLYWKIGKSISEKIISENWGASVVETLSSDLKKLFPEQKGFSRSNLFSMRKWYELYINSEFDIGFIQQLVGQIPWGHNMLIVNNLRLIN